MILNPLITHILCITGLVHSNYILDEIIFVERTVWKMET
jgi:hypothetical protein